MGKRNVHIGNLKLHLPRSAAGSARQIAGGLGDEIIRKVAEATRARHGTMRMEEVSAGKITATAGTSLQSLQQQIAGCVAAELGKRFD